MGNECYSSRQKEPDQFEKSVLQQLEQLKSMPLDIRPNQCKHKQDKQLIELLKAINLNNKSKQPIAEDSIEQRVATQENDHSFGLSIIEDIIKKNNYSLNPLDDWTLLLDDNKSPSLLQVYIKSMELSDKTKINVTRSEFIMPCKPKTFIDCMNDVNLQRQLDNRIDSFHAYEQDAINLEFKLYLSYKGFFMISARDFVYFKKIQLLDEVNDVWCDGSRSVVDVQYNKTGKVRGEILLSGHLVQPLTNVIDQQPYSSKFQHLAYKADSYCIVKLYSECNFKMEVPLVVAKGRISSEMQKFINTIYKQLQ